MWLQSLGLGPVTMLMILAIIVLLLPGMPLAFVTGLVGLIFTLGWFGPAAISLLVNRVYGFVTEYTLVAVPMFVFMASLLDSSGIARDLYDGMRILSRKQRGGLAIQTVFVGFILAAMSGIIGGEIVLLGMLALPQMLRLKYDKRIALGIICASGSLGTMVPPSIVLVIYGLMTSTPIGDLFLAAFPAGALLTIVYVAYLMIRCRLQPSLAPLESDAELSKRTGKEEWIKALASVGPPAFVAFMVLGSIYGGIASVTEAASMGVIAVLIVIVLRREFSLRLLYLSIRQTLNTTGTIVWIGIGASIIVGLYNLMGGNNFVSTFIQSMSISPLAVIVLMMVILLILGMFLDWIGIAMLCMPIFVPIIVSLGMDPVWFGILFAVNMQISYLSPPFGPAVFYLKSVAPSGISLRDIYLSVIPYVCLQLLALTTLILFPQIVMWIIH